MCLTSLSLNFLICKWIIRMCVWFLVLMHSTTKYILISQFYRHDTWGSGSLSCCNFFCKLTQHIVESTVKGFPDSESLCFLYHTMCFLLAEEHLSHGSIPSTLDGGCHTIQEISINWMTEGIWQIVLTCEQNINILFKIDFSIF